MYAQQHRFWLFLSGGLLGLLLTGCGANVAKTIKVSDAQLAKYEALSSFDAIATLEKRINEARNSDMPFLAPNYFRGATEILSAVQKSSDKMPKNELISEIAKADAILDKGHTMITVVQGRLANELALKNQLDKDSVAKVYPKEYEKAISELSSLIEKVELEKTSNIEKDKIELIKMMQALDIKTIQYIALHESEVINEDTQSKDGEKLAPVTLAEALHVYQNAMGRIAEAPHDEASVKRAGDEALFASRHARYVNERVPAAQKVIKESVEAIVLEEEKRLLGISTALDRSDLRDRPIEKQAEEIARMAGEVAQELQKTKQAAGVAADQDKMLGARLKEADEAMRQNKAQLAEKDALISEKAARLAEKEALISGKDAQIADRDAQIADREAQLKTLSEKFAQLEEKDKALSAAEAAKAQPVASAVKTKKEAKTKQQSPAK